jgi:glycosyltransferase 2 family protein
MGKYRNRILIGLGLAFTIYVALLLFTNTEDLIEHLRTYPWALLAPLVLLKLVSWLFRFWEWHYFLGVIGAREKISLLDSIVIYLAGFTMAVSPGKMAEILKSVILKVKTGVPIAVSAPVIIAERVIDGIAVLLLTFGAMLLAGSRMDTSLYQGLIWASTAMLAAGLIAVQIERLAYFALGIVQRLPVVNRFHQPLTDFYESSHEIFRLKHVIPTTLMGFGAYLADAIGFTIILSGFGLEITWSLFLQATFIAGFAAALGALSGVPNGAGVTEISESAMLTAIVAPGNPAMTSSAAITAAVIEGFFHKWFRVLVGMLVAVLFRKRLFSAEVERTIAEMDASRAAPPAVQFGSETP